MGRRVVVLGAGFGGLELATTLAEAFGDSVAVTLIDRSDAFVFGYSKLDVLFGRTTLDAVRLHGGALPAGDDPRARSRGAACDHRRRCPRGRRAGAGARRRLRPRRHAGARGGGNEFSSVAGAAQLRELLPAFSRGRAIVGVCGAPFKCPPAPSEAALLLHDDLVALVRPLIVRPRRDSSSTTAASSPM